MVMIIELLRFLNPTLGLYSCMNHYNNKIKIDRTKDESTPVDPSQNT